MNPTTGATTLLGATGLTKGSNRVGLSTGSSTLYLTVGNMLYTANTATGAATLVGSTGVAGIGALVSTGGTLWGGENQASLQVTMLNTVTGAATAGSAVTGTTSAFWGLAPTPAPANTPEPGTVGLVAGGALALGLKSRMRRKRLP